MWFKEFFKDEKGAGLLGDIFNIALVIVFVAALGTTVATGTDDMVSAFTNYSSAQGIAKLLPFLYAAIPVLLIVKLVIGRVRTFIKDNKGASMLGDVFTIALAIVFVAALGTTVATGTDDMVNAFTNYSAAQGIAKLLPFLYAAIPVLAIVKYITGRIAVDP